MGLSSSSSSWREIESCLGVRRLRGWVGPGGSNVFAREAKKQPSVPTLTKLLSEGCSHWVIDGESEKSKV